MVDKFIEAKSLGFDISCAFKQCEHRLREVSHWGEYAGIGQ